MAAGVKMRSAVARARPAADPTSALDPATQCPTRVAQHPKLVAAGPTRGADHPRRRVEEAVGVPSQVVEAEVPMGA
ncbi:hypothetical protein A5684_20000 [Mycobacterium intracellulare]|nr:hypothetical protein A5684_20000 [Mycobacterium intracellulare]